MVYLSECDPKRKLNGDFQVNFNMNMHLDNCTGYVNLMIKHCNYNVFFTVNISIHHLFFLNGLYSYMHSTFIKRLRENVGVLLILM